MGYFLKLVRTSRPIFWFSHFTLFIYGGLQSNSFHLNSFKFILGVLILSLPFSLFIYAINDYYDIKTDLFNPRKGTIFGEKHDAVNVKALRIWGFTGLAFSLILAGFLGMYVLIMMIVLSLILYSYSALPLRFKSVPIIDALTGGGLYSYLLMVIGYFAFAGSGAKIINIFLAPFILFFLFGLASQLTGSLIDEKPDRKDNINTSVVFFGANKIVSLCLVILLTCLYLAQSNWLFAGFISIFIVSCIFSYSVKWRRNFFLQTLGGAYFPLAFFAITILLYLIDPGLLKI